MTLINSALLYRLDRSRNNYAGTAQTGVKRRHHATVKCLQGE